MKKVEDRKKEQGFKKKCPCCGNCINYKCDKKASDYMPTFEYDINLRCGIGGFAIGKSNWCEHHKYND